MIFYYLYTRHNTFLTGVLFTTAVRLVVTLAVWLIRRYKERRQDDIDKKNWFLTNAEFGKKLGYPDCCIKAFCDQPPSILNKRHANSDDRKRYDASLMDGEYTGFIPCIEHAEAILANRIKLTDLITNRDITFQPFPYWDGVTDHYKK